MELTGEAGNAFRASPSELEDLGLAKIPVTAEEFNGKWRDSPEGKAIDQASRKALLFFGVGVVGIGENGQLQPL